MPDTRRLRVLKAVETILSTDVDKPAGLRVDRKPQQAFDKGHLPHLGIYDGGSPAPQDRGGTLVEGVHHIDLVLSVKGNPDDPPDDTIDPYWSWMLGALFEGQQPTLSGTVALLSYGERDRTQAVEEDSVYVRIRQRLDVTYHHRRDNPELDS